MHQKPTRSKTARCAALLPLILVACLCSSALIAQTAKSPAPVEKPAEVSKPDATAEKTRGFNPNENFLLDGRMIYRSSAQFFPRKMSRKGKGDKDGC